MPSDAVTALNNTLNAIAQEQQENARRVSQCQVEMDRAKVSLQDAEQRAKTVAYEQRLVEKDLHALLDLFNNATEKPYELDPQINKLRGDQSIAAQKSEAAIEIVRARTQALRDAEIRVGVAEEDGREIAARRQKVYALLQQENNK